VQTRFLRSTPAPLTSDDLEIRGVLGVGAHDDRLHQSFSANAVGKLRQFLLTKIAARIKRSTLKLIGADMTMLAINRRSWPWQDSIPNE
jgi:hypothetical protein